MNYLERNQLIIAEIGRRLTLKRGKVVGLNEGRTTTVTSIGHYYSELLGEELYIGLKEYHDEKDFPDLISGRVPPELAIIRSTEQYFPFLLSEFPIFHGLLTNSDGNPLGILTEDFSKDGEYKVESMTRSWYTPFSEGELPKEFEMLFGHIIDEHDLATAYFSVNGRRRIGDFGELILAVPFEEWSKRFLHADIMQDMTKYTLTINYPL